ncbi:MAG: protein kinase [Planctomycetia bacterium]|nr:protein kinase [Planctomycetia bacterium]
MDSCYDHAILMGLVRCELDDARTQEVEDHLAICPDCRRRVGELEQITIPLFDFTQLSESEITCATELGQFDDRFTQFLDTEETLELPLIIGVYEIHRVLEKGGMGILYEAEHLLLRRKVAIKFLRHKRLPQPDMLEHFQREITAAGKLVHPNIVTATDAGTYNGQPFLVMELLSGETVERYVYRNASLSPTEASQITIQAARGLQHAHEAGWIHCDVKPSNLWRTPDGTIKVLDLGLASLQTLGKTASRKGGTPHFMPPEQQSGKEPVDERSDIYSLGCTLYFLLTGNLPEISDPPQPVVVPKTEADIPPTLQNVLRRMTQPQKSRRFASMENVIHALEKFATPRSSTASIATAYVTMLLSLLIFPLPLGIVTVLLGYRNKKRGSILHGRIQIIMGILCAIIGSAIGTFYWMERGE